MDHKSEAPPGTPPGVVACAAVAVAAASMLAGVGAAAGVAWVRMGWVGVLHMREGVVGAQQGAVVVHTVAEGVGGVEPLVGVGVGRHTPWVAGVVLVQMAQVAVGHCMVAVWVPVLWVGGIAAGCFCCWG